MKTYEVVIPIEVAMSVYFKANNLDDANSKAEEMYEDGTLQDEVREHLASDNCVFMISNYEVREVPDA